MGISLIVGGFTGEGKGVWISGTGRTMLDVAVASMSLYLE